MLFRSKDKYNSANEEFHKKWDVIAKENKDASKFTLLQAYEEEYGKSLYDAIDGLSVDSTGLVVDFPVDESGRPNLKISSKMGNLLYDPRYFEGRFKSGLTEVPTNGAKGMKISLLSLSKCQRVQTRGQNRMTVMQWQKIMFTISKRRNAKQKKGQKRRNAKRKSLQKLSNFSKKFKFIYLRR